MKAERWHMPATGIEWKCLLALFTSFFFAAAAAAATAQRSFSSPEEAAQSLVRAVKAQDRPATLAVLGPDADAWISSGDSAADRAAIARFIAAYDAKHAITQDGEQATLTLGEDAFPFAFPIIRSGDRWRFDTAAGKEEMLARRIGQNELSTIKVLQSIVDAQMEFASEDRDGDGIPEYAQKFMSSPGKHDGLYWPVKPGEPMSPLGPLMAQAAAEGFPKNGKGPTPYHGYYYRMLNGQGRNAPTGMLDYVVRGRAIGGFAVVAYPARFRNSGVMTFMVNHDGRIYQANLGPDTQARARQLERFDPGQAWSPVAAQ